VLWIRIRKDPHHIGNLDPDPHPHQKKPDPDPHLKKKLDPKPDPYPYQFADVKPKCIEYEPILALFQNFEASY
jgi:hypothetical protein